MVANDHTFIGRDMSEFQTDVAPHDKRYKLTGQLFCASPIVHMRSIDVLLHALALSLRSPFDDGLGEKCNEFRHRSPLIKRKRGQVRGGGKGRASLSRRCENHGERVDLHAGRRGRIRMVVDAERVLCLCPPLLKLSGVLL